MFTKSFKPLVSIIVPVYNAEKHLNRCLDSLVSQTLKRLEIICVNDGSKDNSLDILLQYSQKFPNIIVFNQENSGPGIARNKALENANGKYIIFCDSDDTLDVNTCLECYNLMETHKIDIIIFNYNVFDVERIEMSTKESFGNGKDMLLVNSKTEGILNKFNT
ncbi:MAG: glycosyltransferase, partial [Treponema sp.]|nr:glycosyltransferase [Treponema sp.]